MNNQFYLFNAFPYDCSIASPNPCLTLTLRRMTMQSIINTEIKPFKANVYHNGKFETITEADLKGKWSVVFFYPADFTFVCPTELEDLADNYAEFQRLGVEI